MVHFVTPLLLVAATFSSLVSAAPLPRPLPDGHLAEGTSKPAVQPDNYNYESGSGYDSQYPPKYEQPSTYEPPSKQPSTYEPPSKQPSTYEPPAKQPSTYEPPKAEAPMHEPPKVEVPMHEPPKAEPPMHSTPVEPVKEVKSTYIAPAPPAPTHGSGSQDWGNDYNSCVNKCMATYGAPATPYTPPPTKAEPPSGGGKVHTVLVAPTTGVLRYVPPFLDVPVGETVKFVWTGPTNHTVSKGSQLDLCNKTAEAFFTSGPKNGSFEFYQTVNNTDPTYFYCAVGKHCASGMFGVINPKKGTGSSNTTIQMMMPQWTKQYPNLANAWDAVHAKTAGTPADTWGDNFDVSQIKPENHEALAANVIYYRGFLGENPGVQDLNSGASLPAGTDSFKLPSQSLQTLLTGTATNPAGAPNVPVAAAPTDAIPTGPAPPEGTQAAANVNSGAGSLKSSGLMVAVVAVLATLVAL